VVSLLFFAEQVISSSAAFFLKPNILLVGCASEMCRTS